MSQNGQEIERRATATTLEVAAEHGFRRAEVEEIKKTIAKGANDVELAVFLRTAQRLGLDPFARQIFLIERYQGGGKVMTPQVSIDGFRLVAERTERYMPGQRPEYTYDDKGALVSAIAYVKKQDAQGEWHVIDCEAFFDEYVQKTRDGQPNSMWRKMPRVMLAKCAEALALRKAFPQQLSGVYTTDELPAEEPGTEGRPQRAAEPRPARRAKAAPSRMEFESSEIAEQGGGQNGGADIIEGEFEDLPVEEQERLAILNEGEAEREREGEIGAQVGEEFAALVAVMTECFALAPRSRKTNYRPLGALKNYINFTYKVNDGLDSLDEAQKGGLLASLQGLRAQAEKDLEEFKQLINES